MELSALGGGGCGSAARSCSPAAFDGRGPAGGSPRAAFGQESIVQYSGIFSSYQPAMYSGVRMFGGGNFGCTLLPMMSLRVSREGMRCGQGGHLGRPGSLRTSSSETCRGFPTSGLLGSWTSGLLWAAGSITSLWVPLGTSVCRRAWTPTPGSLWEPSGSARRAGACLGGSALQGLNN